jgi:hypothetical protein
MPHINSNFPQAITSINQSQQCQSTLPESASRLSRALGFVRSSASKLQAYAHSLPCNKASKCSHATKIAMIKTHLPDKNRYPHKYQETLGQRLYKLRTVGLSGGDPATKQFRIRTPGNIIEEVFNISEKQAHAYLLQYCFQEDSLYNAAEFAMHIEQYEAMPHWAEQFKFLSHTEEPGKVIELFIKNSERVATLYNHKHLPENHRLALESYLKGIEYTEIKKLWNESFLDPYHELLEALVHTGLAEQVMKKFVSESKKAIIEVREGKDSNLLKLLLKINAFKPNTPLDEKQYLIHWAVENKQQDIFDLLLDDRRVNFSVRNADNDMPVMIAERKGYHDMQEQLLTLSESALHSG